MRRNYPKTTGYYVYKHILPNAMYYPGMSSQQPYNRWQPSDYKTTSLQPYIEYFGWDNIEHVIVADGLTKEQAEQLENQLIEEGKMNGLCINKNNSGGYRRDNPKEYQREFYRNSYQNDPEYMERQRQRRQTEEYRVKKREYMRQYRAKKKQQC